MYILVWIVCGIIAGWLTGLIMRGHGFGLVGDLIIGLLGGLIGGFLARAFGLAPTSWIGQIIVAVLGGIVLVAIIRALRKV
jgi:uncharacterized membrane protein YeaQ/YmgE (transglycosylase-associated protein family)